MPTAADLADFLGARIVGETHPHPLRDIVDDSRAVGVGDVYLAIPGRVRHGLDFEDEVVAAGAALVVSDRPARTLPTVVVGDPRRVAGPLADWFHGSPSRELTVHGVTGTNGKSSTAAMLHAGLLGAGREPGLVSGVEITGPGFTAAPTRTTPEATVVHRTLDMFRRSGCDSAVLEVSSHAAVHRRVDGVAFGSMALTNLTPEHLDFHGSVEAYYRAKSSLFTPDRTRRAVVCVDDEHGQRLHAQRRGPARDTAVPPVAHTRSPGGGHRGHG